MLLSAFPKNIGDLHHLKIIKLSEGFIWTCMRGPRIVRDMKYYYVFFMIICNWFCFQEFYAFENKK